MPDRRFTDRLVVLHGFTQHHHHSRRIARAIAASMGSTPSIALVDLPGHGLAHDDRADLDRTVTDLPAVCGPGTWIGYSMGGRHALLAALAGPPEIERLVLIGATPGVTNRTEREQRAALDDERAHRVEAIGTRAFVDEWLAAPMFSNLPDDPTDRAQRYRNPAAGLAHSLRTAGTGRQPDVWERLGEIRIPVLVMAGSRDDKFTAIGTRMVERLADATFVGIDGAGHAAHTERPEAVAAAVARWVDDTARVA